ncbi:Recombination protein RecR [Oligella sp. MSHR50489EDL]|uniref:recombination mediator RecR n=1 Tax=Oligella sp. MSHR50489EDL TaxID=3139409 RepID=UPI003D81C4DD
MNSPASKAEPKFDEPLQELVDSLCQLPGIGERSARRMAYYLLQHDPDSGFRLSKALDSALNNLRHCQLCNSFTTDEICSTCRDEMRDPSVLCVVETPVDQMMIESTRSYRGLYYVLMGKLQPIQGVGALSLSLQRLIERAQDGKIKEVILATNYTTEGETTAHYLDQLLRTHDIKVTRIARGIPAGSELEYVDAGTIAWALMERKG